MGKKAAGSPKKSDAWIEKPGKYYDARNKGAQDHKNEGKGDGGGFKEHGGPPVNKTTTDKKGIHT